MSLLFAILLWLHIFSAIGWMGAAMLFAMVVAPLLPTLNPATRGELILRLFPRYLRYIEAFVVMTLVFGIGLVLEISHGDMGVLSPSTTFGLFITMGALLALLLAILVFGVIAPTIHRLVHMTQEAMKNAGPPPPDLQKASNRLKWGATVGLVLLTVVLVCMVAAAGL